MFGDTIASLKLSQAKAMVNRIWPPSILLWRRTDGRNECRCCPTSHRYQSFPNWYRSDSGLMGNKAMLARTHSKDNCKTAEMWQFKNRYCLQRESTSWSTIVLNRCLHMWRIKQAIRQSASDSKRDQMASATRRVAHNRTCGGKLLLAIKAIIVNNKIQFGFVYLNYLVIVAPPDEPE